MELKRLRVASGILEFPSHGSVYGAGEWWKSKPAATRAHRACTVPSCHFLGRPAGVTWRCRPSASMDRNVAASWTHASKVTIAVSDRAWQLAKTKLHWKRGYGTPGTVRFSARFERMLPFSACPAFACDWWKDLRGVWTSCCGFTEIWRTDGGVSHSLCFTIFVSRKALGKKNHHWSQIFLDQLLALAAPWNNVDIWLLGTFALKKNELVDSSSAIYWFASLISSSFSTRWLNSSSSVLARLG